MDEFYAVWILASAAFTLVGFLIGHRVGVQAGIDVAEMVILDVADSFGDECAIRAVRKRREEAVDVS